MISPEIAKNVATLRVKILPAIRVLSIFWSNYYSFQFIYCRLWLPTSFVPRKEKNM